MAILILGATKCPICNQIIEKSDEAISFPPFIPNQLDPLYLFHDASFHAVCFRNHPLASAAKKRYVELKEHARVRIDIITKTEITNPDDYFTLGHLTDDEANPL